MVSRFNDADHPEPVARFNWRARLSTALAGLVLFVGIEICPADIALLLYIFIVAILLLSSSVLLVCAAIGKNRRRYLQQLSTLMIFLVVAVGVIFFGRMYPFAIRSAARWLVWSQDYKAHVLSQPSPLNNELKLIEWDGSGFAGVANNTAYLAFDWPRHAFNSGQELSTGQFQRYPVRGPSGTSFWRAIGMLFSFTLTKLGTNTNRANSD
jgi:hypothetical protein